MDSWTDSAIFPISVRARGLPRQHTRGNALLPLICPTVHPSAQNFDREEDHDRNQRQDAA